MSAVSPITRQTVGRTFIAAISTLGVGALAQLAVIGWFFMARFHAAPPVKGAAATTLAGPRTFADPFADPGAPAVAAAPRGAVTPPPKPTPVSQAALLPAVPPSTQERFEEQVEQARALRDHGDTYAAVIKLREAAATNPRDPRAPAELAMTYEKMGAVDKAVEAWNRVYDMGEAAGIYFEAAKSKRLATQERAQREAAPMLTGPSATPAPGAAPEVVGLGPNSKLGMGEVVRNDETDTAAARKFTLQVPVRAKARARIDVRDVIVQVLFYDVVNNKALDRTNAQVSYKWSTPPADWSEHDVETLEVSYLLPVAHASDETRDYYGYVASVYYKNALQDFRSDPPALGQRLPPKRVLNESTE